MSREQEDTMTEMKAARSDVFQWKMQRDLHRSKVFGLLDELEAVELLRQHAPADRQYQVDRLANSLKALNAIEIELEGALDELARIEELWEESLLTAQPAVMPNAETVHVYE